MIIFGSRTFIDGPLCQCVYQIDASIVSTQIKLKIVHRRASESSASTTAIRHQFTHYYYLSFSHFIFNFISFRGYRLITHTHHSNPTEHTHQNQQHIVSGVSGFDSSGHGHYYANNNNNNQNPAQSPYYQQQPPLPSTNPHQQSPPRPFQHPSQAPNAPQYNTHHQPQSYGSQSSSGSGNAGYGSSGTNYNSNKGGSSYAGGWNYVNGNDRNNQHQSQTGYGQDKDTPQR